MYSTRGPTRAIPGLCGALLLLGGCGPAYEVRDVLVPPPDPAARQCIQDCERSARACSGRCDRAYELCAGEAASEARDMLAAALELHSARQEAYRAKKDLVYTTGTIASTGRARRARRTPTIGPSAGASPARPGHASRRRGSRGPRRSFGMTTMDSAARWARNPSRPRNPRSPVRRSGFAKNDAAMTAVAGTSSRPAT